MWIMSINYLNRDNEHQWQNMEALSTSNKRNTLAKQKREEIWGKIIVVTKLRQYWGWSNYYSWRKPRTIKMISGSSIVLGMC